MGSRKLDISQHSNLSYVAVPRKTGDFFWSDKENGSSYISDREQGRIETVERLIPSDIHTLLDVGCGDGRMMKSMQQKVKVFGLDYSNLSARNFCGTGVCGSSLSLPFSDSSFDLVMCCEVLEHFSDAMFTATVAEIQRVAKKFILISVPYKEDLRRGNTKCGECGHIFNIWGHLRRFSNPFLNSLFPTFRVKQTQYYGKRHPYMNSVALWINQQFGDRWNWVDGAACPQCGNDRFVPSPRTLVTMACGVINAMTGKLVPVKNKHWIFKLYESKA